MRVQKTFMMEIEFIDQLTNLASKADRTISWLLNTAIQEYLTKMQSQSENSLNTERKI